MYITHLARLFQGSWRGWSHRFDTLKLIHTPSDVSSHESLRHIVVSSRVREKHPSGCVVSISLWFRVPMLSSGAWFLGREHWYQWSPGTSRSTGVQAPRMQAPWKTWSGLPRGRCERHSLAAVHDRICSLSCPHVPWINPLWRFVEVPYVSQRIFDPVGLRRQSTNFQGQNQYCQSVSAELAVGNCWLKRAGYLLL